MTAEGTAEGEAEGTRRAARKPRKPARGGLDGTSPSRARPTSPQISSRGRPRRSPSLAGHSPPPGLGPPETRAPRTHDALVGRMAER